MANAGVPLAQARNAGTSTVQIYSPSSGNTTVTSVIVCNTSGAEALFTLYMDADGTTYDEASAIFWLRPIPAGETKEYPSLITMAAASNLAYKTSVGNALTVTVSGMEVT